jgi:hypothetical protein
MKYYIVGFGFLIALLMIKCAAPKKVGYEFPPEMSQQVRNDFSKQCEKGMILYDINCAGCHNKKVGRREIIPDFTSDQLRGYELRVANPDHESGIPETNVSAEELGLIMTFLSYKKKNK